MSLTECSSGHLVTQATIVNAIEKRLVSFTTIRVTKLVGQLNVHARHPGAIACSWPNSGEQTG